VLDLIKPDNTEQDIVDAMITWWQNIRRTGGLRLTEIGDGAFRLADLEYHEFDAGSYNNSLSSIGLMAKLDKKMPAPFFIVFQQRRKYVRVYDSRIALVMALYDDFNAYLESLEDNND
jgi:hypothetical protein